MDAKVQFTNDFIKKTKGKKLTPREIGKLRWQKIVEAEKRGELQFCGTRKDVAVLAGYDKESKAGVMWVRNMINRGHLTETLAEAKGIYSTYYYSTGSKPKHVGFEAPLQPRPQQPTKATIRYNDLEITLEGYSASDVATVAKGLQL